jgi:cytidyltransferase-like protein
MKRIVLVTGGFDPLHSGHIEYFKAAKALGDELHVGLNSDEWLINKKGRPFMPFLERANVIENLSVVDKVVAFDDSDGSACGAIYKTMATHGDIKIIFANGGDRTNTTTPEYKTYGDMPKVEFAFGVGGENKMNSSSWILDEWKAPKTEHWFVAEGTATVYTLNQATDIDDFGVYTQHQSLHIPIGMWHQLSNEHDVPLKLVEIQYGEECIEEDIERR